MERELPGMDAFVRHLHGSLIADAQRQVEFGVKRFAKALKKAGAMQGHVALMDAVCQALGLQSWSSLIEVLRGNDAKAVKALENALQPVINVPLPKYECPNAALSAHLRSLAPGLAHLTGLTEQVVLDQVIGYVHEASSFQELLDRDPCLHTPLYELVDQAPDGPSFLVPTRIYRAAVARLVADEKALVDQPGNMVARLRQILRVNPSFVPAWSRLVEMQSDEYGGSSTEDLQAGAAEVVELLDTYGPDALHEEIEVACANFGALAISSLCKSGDPSSAYELAASLVDLCGDHGFRFHLAACSASSTELAEAFFDVEWEDIFVRDVRTLDLDGLLLLGLVHLACEGLSSRSGLMYLYRAYLMADQFVLDLLNADDGEHDLVAARHSGEHEDDDDEEGRGLAFTAQLVGMVRANNPAVLDMALAALRQPEAEQEASGLEPLRIALLSIDEQGELERSETVFALQCGVFSASQRLVDMALSRFSVAGSVGLH